MGAIGSGPSLPTYPLANSFNDVVVAVTCCFDEMGANAAVFAVNATTIRQSDFIMMDVVIVRLFHCRRKVVTASRGFASTTVKNVVHV